MNGISANVSRTLSHLDFPRVMSQAMGIPARRSNAETTSATTNEADIALKALPISSGWSRTVWMAPHLIAIPKTGGRRISTKKTTNAERYTVYFTDFLDDKAFKVFMRL